MSITKKLLWITLLALLLVPATGNAQKKAKLPITNQQLQKLIKMLPDGPL
ncbi:hypothetical protein [Pontibacter qinzhouensis]|nr:hypothetical protein [Pontibacter qinzhouensis]